MAVSVLAGLPLPPSLPLGKGSSLNGGVGLRPSPKGKEGGKGNVAIRILAGGKRGEAVKRR